ncbi:MAG: damage-inducible protein DinB [Flavobacterium sp.]|nr:damage-inducible protein DinB [Pedobacter sp.]
MHLLTPGLNLFDMIAELIRYSQTADQKIIEIFDQSDKQMPEAEKVFSHVLNAQHIWMKRIIYEHTSYFAWQIHDRKLFERIHLENFLLIVKIFKEVNPEENIMYQNSLGLKYTCKVSDIFVHVVNHSTYHRGQIATLFKSAGIMPPVTDYIILKREGLI